MRPKRSTIYRSLIAALAISALAGCAQFQDSFGEITNPDPSPVQYASRSLDSRPVVSKDPDGERNFIYRGVKVELSKGEVTE